MSKGEIEMSITVDLSPADIEFVQAQAAAGNVSVEEFSREAIMKAARNASYLAKIDHAFQQMHDGTGTILTDKELKALVYENNI